MKGELVASEEVDLAKTLIQVHAKLVKDTPSNFRILDLKTCATCKFATCWSAEEIVDCKKHADNKAVGEEIYYNTTCDDYQPRPTLDASKLDSTCKFVPHIDTGLQIDKVKR